MLWFASPRAHQVHPDTVLEGHSCCFLGFAPAKMIVIGLKKYKQANVSPPPQKKKKISAARQIWAI